jgi:hypothetical protein
MVPTTYELTESVAGFDEGAVLDVTARFGDWHTFDLKLKPTSSSAGSTTVVVADDPGFTEAEVLDPTARFGDWHEFDLAFEPSSTTAPGPSDGRARFTTAEFERVAEPVGLTG